MGTQRHEEKVTYYTTTEDLMDVEQAVLVLRKLRIRGVDRGTVVRTALKLVVPELLAKGRDSQLYRALAPLPEDSGIPNPALFETA